MEIKLNDLAGRLYKLNLLRRDFIQESTVDIALYFGQLPILEYVIEHDKCTQKEIADRLSVTPASIAISTKRMQKAGLLEKKVDENNLRCNRLTVTKKGHELSKQYRLKFDEMDKKMFVGFGEDELKQVNSYLSRLIMNITGDVNDEISIYSVAALEEKLDKKMRSRRNAQEEEDND